MIYKLQQSSKTNGIPLTFDTKEEMLDAASALIGNPGLHRLTLSWAPEPQDEVNTKYPIQECAITDHPPRLEKMPGIEEVKPAPKKRGRPKKQTALETDDDADYKNQLNQNTKPGDGGDFENTSGCYE